MKWSWPERQGFFIFRHWDIDLPQSALLQQPVPIPEAGLLLVRSARPQGKLYALDIYHGNKVWQWDALPALLAAAAASDPPYPGLTRSSLQLQHVMCDWGTFSLYVTLSVTLPSAGVAAGGTPDDATGGGGAGSSGGGNSSSGGASAGGNGWRERGWLWSVDVRSGQVRWSSGPLPGAVTSLVSTEEVLLVGVEQDSQGGALLYGLDKATGVTRYTQKCDVAPCSLEVIDLHVGVLTASLTQGNLSLDGLAAFNLTSGQQLWQGVAGGVQRWQQQQHTGHQGRPPLGCASPLLTPSPTQE
ncbi:hypothetical protein V8C86DRAFT_2521894 [Haematococcus lacustris]